LREFASLFPFSKMDRLIFHNDRIVPLSEAHLSPGQVGLLTGWGVFTTLRIYHGQPFAFERHWSRMSRDAARLGVPLPYESHAIQEATIALAKANGNPECMARIAFVKNKGGLWAQADDHNETDVLIFTRDLVPWPAAQRLMLAPSGIFSGGHYSGTKMLSWVSHAGVLRESHDAGYDDALLTNEKDKLAECTSANIFLIQNGRVLTPALSSGCLAGITREILLEVVPAAGIEVREADLTTEDLAKAQEVFISSTTREVAPINFISPQWNFPAPGPLTVRIAEIFKHHVQSWLANIHRGTRPS
jgi:branched-chain amino acid aminotransferase